MPDAGRRRHLSWGMDFDSRASALETQISDDWEPQVKEMHLRNRAQTIEGLTQSFGSENIDSKIENFVAIGIKPMSVLSYHNKFFEQVRRTFVMSDYYPALVGACALGERILNHMLLDLRSYYSHTPEYKKIYRKESFDDWDQPIDILETWGILLPPAASEFRSLKGLRNKSIHFNLSTYTSLREDALAAIIHLRSAIEGQFGSFALRPWFISDTKGHVFIRKSYETNPFVAVYFLPRCPFVGPLFGMEFTSNGWKVNDLPNYGPEPWTDEEFADRYNARKPEDVVSGTQSGELPAECAP